MDDAPQKILVVDDMPENILVIENAFKALSNIEIISVSRGKDALVVLEQHEISLALLDVNIPEMDGFELAQHIRENKKTMYIPIIFITAVRTEEKYMEFGFETGGIDYILKPFNSKFLRSKVKLLLEWSRQRDDLKEKNEQIMRFVALLAHDLRNPISCAQMSCYLMEDDAKYDDKFLGLVQKSLKNATDLIQDVLDIATLEIGQIEFNMSETSIKDLVLPAHSQTKLQADKKGIIFNVDLDVKGLVTVDAKRIHQVLVNLTSNAIKFTPEGKSIILRVIKNDSQVVFEVEDTGVGISDKIVNDIFKKDVKTSRTGTNGEPGTGLGLPLCQDILAAHNTQMTVESVLGKGTTFRFALPLLKAL